MASPGFHRSGLDRPELTRPGVANRRSAAETIAFQTGNFAPNGCCSRPSLHDWQQAGQDANWYHVQAPSALHYVQYLGSYQHAPAAPAPYSQMFPPHPAGAIHRQDWVQQMQQLQPPSAWPPVVWSQQPTSQSRQYVTAPTPVGHQQSASAMQYGLAPSLVMYSAPQPYGLSPEPVTPFTPSNTQNPQTARLTVDSAASTEVRSPRRAPLMKSKVCFGSCAHTRCAPVPALSSSLEAHQEACRGPSLSVLPALPFHHTSTRVKSNSCLERGKATYGGVCRMLCVGPRGVLKQ